MAPKLIPLGSVVVVKEVKGDWVRQGAIYAPQVARGNQLFMVGVVEAVGPVPSDETMRYLVLDAERAKTYGIDMDSASAHTPWPTPRQVQVGDFVVINRYGLDPIDLAGVRYYLPSRHHILAVLDGVEVRLDDDAQPGGAA